MTPFKLLHRREVLFGLVIIVCVGFYVLLKLDSESTRDYRQPRIETVTYLGDQRIFQVRALPSPHHVNTPRMMMAKLVNNHGMRTN